ncbi:MAG: Rrf2 family transcriptional regulator [Nitrospinae bacterium]|nr:Rrf2 family transcriptional regulator [Nitrospinota bacterium]
MISQTAEYALRAVACLATYPKTSLTAPRIASITKVPASYLSKVLQALGKARLVKSQRGLHGGFLLARPADKISLLDVIDAVDPIRPITQCPLDLETHGKNLCPLHDRLNDAIMLIQKAYRNATVGELVSQTGKSKPLCDMPDRKKIS